MATKINVLTLGELYNHKQYLLNLVEIKEKELLQVQSELDDLLADQEKLYEVLRPLAGALPYVIVEKLRDNSGLVARKVTQPANYTNVYFDAPNFNLTTIEVDTTVRIAIEAGRVGNETSPHLVTSMAFDSR